MNKNNLAPVFDAWQERHRNPDITYLSGNGLSTLDLLKLPLPSPGSQLLSIGVGMGIFEQRMSEAGVIVDAVDISPLALERVAPYTRWRGHVIPASVYGGYDYITELLVAQHVSDDVLEIHISGAIQALKPDSGIYALQSPAYGLSSQSIEAMLGGSICRSPEWIRETVARHGGITEVHEGNRFPGGTWYIYHIRKMG